MKSIGERKSATLLGNPRCIISLLSKIEGREGVKWELGLAILWIGKMGFTHWDWDLATGMG